MNAFEEYGKRATSTVPPRLIGVTKTRGEARARYAAIIADLTAVKTLPALEQYLTGIAAELIQFRTELDFLWEGDGDFAGLQQEIERAQVRLDAGLDHPRHEVKQQEEGLGL